MIVDIIGQVLLYGIPTTPIISFFIVRRIKGFSITWKVIIGILVTFILGATLLAIAIAIFLRNGLGPG